MATKAKAKAVGDEPAADDPLAEGPATHSGWDHDWRNAAVKFAADDHCANAEMRRLADANYR